MYKISLVPHRAPVREEISMAHKRQQLAAPLLPPAIPAEGKHIIYDRETRDYAMYLDAQLIGFARTHHEAETSLDELVDEIQRHTRATTADMAAEAAELRREREAA
jgi:hypothetical protein